MSGTIIAFPSDRKHKLPSTRRAEAFQQFRELYRELKRRKSGEVLTDAQCDQFAHEVLACIDEARAKLHGKQ